MLSAELEHKVGLVLAALFLGIALGFALFSPPHCPQEDSCTVDYFDGAWHVIPLDPDQI